MSSAVGTASRAPWEAQSLLESTPSTCVPCQDGPYTPRVPPWCRASPCLCSDPLLSLKTGARALCTPDSAQGRPGSSGPSAQIRNRPPERPGLHTAPSLLPTLTSPRGSPPEFPLWHLPAFDPLGAQTPSALLLPGPCNSFSFCCQNSVSVYVLGPD